MDNNKENKLDNKDKIRNEINISKIKNTNLASAEKNNYTHISTLNYSIKKKMKKIITLTISKKIHQKTQ